MLKEINRTTQIALRTFETDVELRSFVIRFQNVAKKLNKIPYFVISKNMKQLEYLDLDGTMVQDLSPISELSKLKKLSIIGCYEIHDLSPLHKHPSLELLIVFEDGLMQQIPEEFIKLQQARPDIIIEEE